LEVLERVFGEEYGNAMEEGEAQILILEYGMQLIGCNAFDVEKAKMRQEGFSCEWRNRDL
jgi:hypothetical protein